MIGRDLQEGMAQHGGRLALMHGTKRVSYADIGLLVNAMVEAWQALSGKRVGVCITSPFSFIGAVAALDLLESHAFLVGQRGEEELNRLQDVFRWDGLLREEDVPVSVMRQKDLEAPRLNTGLVTLLTSGTTGAPKAVQHSWTTLSSPVRKEERYIGTRWLLSYPLNLYAGTQVFLQVFLNRATLVIPTSLERNEIARTLRQARVTHATGTPTFWRHLLLFASRDELKDCELQQITLGGEIATQEVLDDLRLAFPRARIVHIYASTELGRVFSVTDGREGFPTTFLEEPPEEGTELRIVDGELLARSRNAMIAYGGQIPLRDSDDGWFTTGDLVEVRGDRVLFKGRSSDIINVGGRKIYPTHVEATLCSVPSVAHIRVYAKQSSLVGQLVAADVVLAPNTDEDAARAEIRRVARKKLQPHEVPRILRVVPEMTMNSAFKLVREQTQG